MIVKDNSCKICKYFKNKDCVLKGNHSPIRNCVIGINRDIVEKILESKKNIKILDVGCGSWSEINNRLPENAVWYGIDVNKKNKSGNKTIATKIGSVGKIPYESSYFDIIIANQSIEHWYEYGVTFDLALSEISRVLKKNGMAVINAPIFLHGHKYFLKGEISKIRKLINRKFWKVEFQYWRKDYRPLMPYYGWKKSHEEHFVGNNSTYILNIILKKKKQQKHTNINRFKSKCLKVFVSLIPHKFRAYVFLAIQVSPLYAIKNGLLAIKNKKKQNEKNN